MRRRLTFFRERRVYMLALGKSFRKAPQPVDVWQIGVYVDQRLLINCQDGAATSVDPSIGE